MIAFSDTPADAAVTRAQSNSTRIMPVGDSITQGNDAYDSYRRDLWHMLQQNGYTNIDFVGNFTLNYDSNGGADVPPPNPDFDRNHQGDGGKRADQIAKQLGHAPPADIALVHVGHNDISQGQSTYTTLTDIKRVIHKLRQKNRSVTVLLAKVIDSCGRREQGIINLNAQIDAVAASQDASHSRVFVVDHTANFDPQRHTYDCTHPNEAGQQVMAQTWFDKLETLLARDGGDPAPPPSDPEPPSDPNPPSDPDPNPPAGDFPVEGVWYHLENVSTGTYIDTDAKGMIKLSSSSAGNDSEFRFIANGSGAYWIDNRQAGRGALHTTRHSTVRWKGKTQPDGGDKLWVVEPVDDGTYRFKNVHKLRAYMYASGTSVRWNAGSQNEATLWRPAPIN